MTKVLVSFIQDRSGSMADVWKETLSGFKTYVESLQEDQKKDGAVEYLFTLTAFDTQIDTPHLGIPIADVKSDVLKGFGPRGATAIYDAVGKTLQAIDDNKNLTFDKAIVVIVTDGMENSSREWSKDALHAAIDDRIKRGNWTFTYLGTQPETWDDASSLGMGVGASATYNAQNSAATYAVLSSASSNMARSVCGQSTSFLHDNTTRSMRSAVKMSTQDDANGVPVNGGFQSVVVPASSSKPNIPSPLHPVKHNAPAKTGRKWK